jgi:hypothetical protein
MLEMDEDGNGTRSPLVFCGLAAISDLPGC